MSKESYPITSAVRCLRSEGVDFVPHLYDYVEHGGTRIAAEQLGIEENKIVKTIVLEDEARCPLIVLMHGDKEVSTKNLSRLIGVKKLVPCSPQVVTKHTGYIVGGTSPFGTKNKLQVYLEKTIAELDSVLINGGKRGFLVEIKVVDLLRVIAPIIVEVGV